MRAADHLVAYAHPPPPACCCFLCFLFLIFSPNFFALHTRPSHSLYAHRATPANRASPYHYLTYLTSHREKRDTYTYTRAYTHIHASYTHTRIHAASLASSAATCVLAFVYCCVSLFKYSLQVPPVGARCLVVWCWYLLDALVLVPLLCRFSPAYPYVYGTSLGLGFCFCQRCRSIVQCECRGAESHPIQTHLYLYSLPFILKP